MMLLKISLVWLFAISCAAEIPLEKNYQQEIKDDEGNVYNLNITDNDKVEELELTDRHGKRIVDVEYFKTDGYQIDKPANENVCLLVQALEENEERHECYKRDPADKAILSQDILNYCEGRDIYVLIPNDKTCEKVKQGLPEEEEQTGLSNGQQNIARRKRAVVCSGHYYKTLRSRQYKYCCRYLFLFCSKRCTRVEWYYATSYVYQCRNYYG